MSSIHKELTELAIKMGAPVVGHNVSEQIRAINVHLGGTSHGANISERIDELTKVWSDPEPPTPEPDKSVMDPSSYEVGSTKLSDGFAVTAQAPTSNVISVISNNVSKTDDGIAIASNSKAAIVVPFYHNDKGTTNFKCTMVFPSPRTKLQWGVFISLPTLESNIGNEIALREYGQTILIGSGGGCTIIDTDDCSTGDTNNVNITSLNADDWTELTIEFKIDDDNIDFYINDVLKVRYPRATNVIPYDANWVIGAPTYNSTYAENYNAEGMTITSCEVTR